jgi:hypothetical protein
VFRTDGTVYNICATHLAAPIAVIPIPHLNVIAAQRECVRPSFGFPMNEFIISFTITYA